MFLPGFSFGAMFLGTFSSFFFFRIFSSEGLFISFLISSIYDLSFLQEVCDIRTVISNGTWQIWMKLILIKQMILDDIGVVDGYWMMNIDAIEDVAWCDGLMLMLSLIGDDG